MPDKLLIVGPSWVGDMVLAQSLFKLLKQQRPHCRIEVAAPAWTLPLLERMPEVDAGIPLPFQHGQLALMERLKLGKSLRGRGYSQAILLTNSLKSGILPFAAKVPRRTGFLGELRYGLLNDIRPLDKSKLPRTVDRFVTLGLEKDTPLPIELPRPSLNADQDNAQRCLHRLGRHRPTAPVLGLCPGAEYGEAKRWPAEYYAEVARQALAAGWETWLFGSAKDQAVTAEINRLSGGRCLDLGGKTQLGEAIDLMALASKVVSNDSGLMHIAAALGKPLVAIFGSSDPYHTPPMQPDANVLYLGLSCSPCFKRVCPLGHFRCMYEIKPSQVTSAICFANSI